MFIRFIAPSRIADVGARSGFFVAAYALRETPTLDPSALARLGELLQWFEAKLETPPRFNRTRSKGYYRRNATAGISWFKDTEPEMLAKAHELARLLGEHGVPIEMIRAERVGYVLYEDDHQIVAEPFSDMRG